MSWLTYLLKTRPVSTSNWQIINDLYNCNINSLLLHRKVRLIIPNTDSLLKTKMNYFTFICIE